MVVVRQSSFPEQAEAEPVEPCAGGPEGFLEVEKGTVGENVEEDVVGHAEQGCAPSL